MKEITLDLQPFEDKVSLHIYLKTALDFPFYYGANLDALHDELTSNTEETVIHVKYPASPKGSMAGYIPRLLEVFEDSAKENYHLKVDFQKIR